MDKIFINDLKVYAYHGVNTEEKIDGQNFYLDIVIDAGLSKPCETDDVEDTISYAKVIKTAIRVMTAEKYDLIEKAAQKVCDAILEEYSKAEVVTITLKKPEAPMKADFGNVGITLTRSRK